MTSRATRSKALCFLSLLAALGLLLWLAAGVGTPWCLDDGLRSLAASGPSLAGVHDLGAAVNTDSPLGVPVFPDKLTRATFPVIRPFVHWQDGRPLLVFPTLYLAFLWAASRLGAAGPMALAFMTGLVLAWAARRFLRREAQPDGPAPPWLIGLLASPVLFYLGINWEIGLTTALLLLLLQERRDPLPPALSLAYGLLPALRPEMLLVWAGGPFLVRGHLRRILAVAGALGAAGLHYAWTGSWFWLQVLENVGGSSWRPLARLLTFWLPLPTAPWLWAGLAVLALLAWSGWRGGSREKTVAWLLALALALALALFETVGIHPLQPCWGALLTAPLAVGALTGLVKRGQWRDLVPELLVLVAFLLVVSLASPVSQGFHWGPRLLVPALVPLGLWFVSREPAGWPRRLAMGLSLGAQLISLLLLAGRHELVERQDRALAALRAPALVTSEFYQLGDHPFLAKDRLVYLPWGETPARALISGLQDRGVREIDLVTPPGHPLTRFLEEQLGLRELAAPREIPGGRLGHVMEWRRLGL